MRSPPPFRIQTHGLTLLKTWCDGLLAHQVPSGDDHGGFLCPATGRVPGRCADAVYPLLALHRRIGDTRYRQAALDVFDWAERHVSQPDGSWLNETDVPWKGITVFGVIALGEALCHDADALPAAQRDRWRERLRRGADYLMNHMTFETGDVNYPLSTAAALALAATVLADEKYLPRARAFAHFAVRHVTDGGLIWGEGERGPADVSPRGLRAIDIVYNVEETLPNLATYARLTGDDAIERLTARSLRAHLPFLLPNGAWDAGWASRQYKWCYWGSATCDGAASGLRLLRHHDPRFADAADRNLDLLRRCTHDGLLHAGPGLYARGLPPLIHHTFVRAKGLAAALDADLHDTFDAAADIGTHAKTGPTAIGLRSWPEAGIVQFARGDWRGSVTTNDIPQSAKRGGQPAGGALTLLWHAAVGPLCVASMNDYVRYEGRNMSPAADAGPAAVSCLTPRIELRVGDRIFCNVYDRTAVMESAVKGDAAGEEIAIRVRGVLRDRLGDGPAGGAAFVVAYGVTADTFTITAHVEADGASLHVPLVSPASDPVRSSPDDGIIIVKSNAIVQAIADGGPLRSDAGERVFNFVPGLEAVAVRVPMTRGRDARVTISVRPTPTSG